MFEGISPLTENLYNKTKNKDIKFIDSDTLSKMPDELKACKKEWKEYERVMGDANSKAEDAKIVTDALASAYVNNGNFLSNITTKNRDYYVAQMESIGITNAAAIADQALSYEKEIAANKEDTLAIAAEAAKGKISDQSQALINNATMSKMAKAALIDLATQEEIFNNGSLSTEDKVKSLNRLAKSYFGVSGAVKLVNAGVMGTDPRYQKPIEEQWNDFINSQDDIKIDTTPVNPDKNKDKGKDKSNENKTEPKSTQQIDWISRALDRLSSKLDLVKAKYDNLFANKKAKDSDSLLTLQNKNLDDQYRLLRKTENYQKKAQQKYTAKADKVRISKNKKEDKSLKKAVADGRINAKGKGSMSKLIATYGEKKAENIQKYQDWYDKAREAEKNRETTRTAMKENRIQKYQGKVDNADEKRSLVQARKENAKTAAAKNDLIRDEKDYVKTSYNYQIKIARLEKDSVKVAQLKAEKKKELRDLDIEHHQNLADEYQGTLDKYSAEKELETTAAGKNSIIEKEKGVTSQLYAEKIAMAQSEDEVLQLQAEHDKQIRDLQIEQHQNLADEYQMTLDRYGAAKALATTAAERNSHIDAEKQTTEALYDQKIAMAQLEGNTNEAIQLQYEKEKALRDLEVERHQNLADEHQSNLDLLSAQKENLKTADEKNSVVDREKDATIQLYKEKIEIARIEGNTTEELKLQEELNQKLVVLEKEKLDNIVEYYSNLRKINEHQAKNLSNSVDELEARGLIATRGLYEAQGTLNDDRKRNLEEELIQLEGQLNSIDKDSPAYYESLDSIQSCKDEIAGCVMNAIELNNAIRNIDWKVFDKVASRFDLLSSEYDLAIELMSDKQLIDENTGNFTAEGTATLGAYYSELLLAQEKTGEFKRTLDEMKEHIDNGDDGYTDQKALDEYYEKYSEYIELVKSEHGIQQKLIDMMKQRYQAELDCLQDIINKRKELLQTEKDAYDYQRNIEEKTKNIGKLSKQIEALSGDDSEATKAKIQQLQVSLDDAQRDLQDTEYDKWISDQETMLDNLYNEYSDFIEDHLNDTDALIHEAVTFLSKIDVGKSVGDCLNDYYAKHGYDPTDDFNSINDALGEDGSIVKAIGDGVNSILEYSERQQRYQEEADAVSSTVSEIGNVYEDPKALSKYEAANYGYNRLATAGDNGENIQKYMDQSSVSTLNTKRKEAKEVYTLAGNFNTEVAKLGSFDDISSYTDENGEKLNKLYKMYEALPTSAKSLVTEFKGILDRKQSKYKEHGQTIQAEKEAEQKAAAQQADDAVNPGKRADFEKAMRETYLSGATTYADVDGTYEHSDELNNLLKQYGLFREVDGFSINQAGIARVMSQLGWSRSYDHNPTGMLRLMKSIGFSQGGVAQTLQTVPGMNGDSGWVTLKKGEAVLTPEQTRDFQKLAQNLNVLNLTPDILQAMSRPPLNAAPNPANGTTIGDVYLNVDLPNVTNYEEFKQKMQSDPKIEQMFKSMIWDKNSLSKYSIRL